MRPSSGGPARPQAVLALRQTPRTRPRMAAGGSVCSTVAPAVSDSDSTTAMGATTTSSRANVGDRPASTWSSAPAAASSATTRTVGRRSRPARNAPTIPPTASTAATVAKSRVVPARAPVTSTARVSE
nr:hypothetical protein [Promicromonospora panici]